MERKQVWRRADDFAQLPSEFPEMGTSLNPLGVPWWDAADPDGSTDSFFDNE